MQSAGHSAGKIQNWQRTPPESGNERYMPICRLSLRASDKPACNPNSIGFEPRRKAGHGIGVTENPAIPCATNCSSLLMALIR
jgi:hypothetical protein